MRLVTVTALKAYFCGLLSVGVGCVLLLTLFPIKSASGDGSQDWTDDKWTGNNAPYAVDRQQVLSAISASRYPKVDLNLYKAQALLSPNNPETVFKWAVAALKLAANETTGNATEADIAGVQDALDAAPSPHVYEYTRIRFLYACIHEPGAQPKLKAVAIRLLGINNRDPEVLKCAAFCFDPDVKKCTDFMEQAIALTPKDPKGYYELGLIDCDEMLATHDPTAKKRMVAALTTFLKMTPVKNDYTAAAESLIAKSKEKD